MTPIIYYRWRVTKPAPDDVWRSKGKVLRWEMTEAAAAEHMAKVGDELEKVPGSGSTRAPVGMGHFPGPTLEEKEAATRAKEKPEPR